MNEQFRKLAEQATEYANEQNELHGVGYVITFKEKFAELIVQECARLADNSPQYIDGREILEHFGVSND